MPKKQNPAKRPSEVFADRMRFIRERRGWSQQDLADRLAAMGEVIDRATIARTETRARGLSLDDALAYAAALGASPIHMAVPPSEAEVALAPDFIVSSRKARAWIKGVEALRPDDAKTLYEEVSDDDWTARHEKRLGHLISLVQDLVDYVVDDDREAAADVIDTINVELERQRAELTRKERGRGQR